MNTENTSDASQDRSPKYPRITLQDAVEKIGAAHKQIGKSSVAMETAASALGFKSLGGGATQVVLSALQQYGLLFKGDDKKASISSLAIKILHPTGEEQRDQALKEAALLPPIFSEIRKNYHDCSESVLTSHLVQSRFTPDGASRASAIYKANSSFAKLDLAAYNKPDDKKGNEHNVRKQDFTLVGGPQELIDYQEEVAAANEKNKAKKVLAQYSIPLGSNEATLVFKGEQLSADDFDALGEFVTFAKKQFERKQKTEQTNNLHSNIAGIFALGKEKSPKTE
jgi:hypothetical protein